MAMKWRPTGKIIQEKSSRNDESRRREQRERKNMFCEIQTANIDTVCAGIDDLQHGSICSILMKHHLVPREFLPLLEEGTEALQRRVVDVIPPAWSGLARGVSSWLDGRNTSTCIHADQKPPEDHVSAEKRLYPEVLFVCLRPNPATLQRKLI